MVRAFSDETADLVGRDKGAATKFHQPDLAAVAHVVEGSTGDPAE
jgi:hypothetical protein